MKCKKCQKLFLRCCEGDEHCLDCTREIVKEKMKMAGEKGN
ncbi:MAG: hypothetical protein AABW86_02170 [Candidatus Micrarchaeota archaeon]